MALPDFISDSDMAALDSGGGSSSPDFISDEQMQALQSGDQGILSSLAGGAVKGVTDISRMFGQTIMPGAQWAGDAVDAAANAIGIDPNGQPDSGVSKFARNLGYLGPSVFGGEGSIISKALQAAGGAAGLTSAQESGAGPLAETAATALGMGVPGLVKGAVTGGIDAIKAIPSVFVDPAAKAAAVKDAALNVIDEFTPRADALKAIQKGEPRVAASFDAPYIRTAEQSQDEGLAALERTLAMDKTSNFQGDRSAQDILREDLRQSVFNRLQPYPGGGSAINLTPEESSGAMRSAIEGRLDASKTKVTGLAEKALPAGGGEITTRSPKAAVTATINQLTSTGARSIDGGLSDLVDRFKALPPTTDLRTLHDFRSAFGEYARPGIMATTAERQQAKIAASIRDAIDGSVDRAVQMGNLGKRQKAALQQMIVERRQQQDLYRSGVVGDIIERDPESSRYLMDATKAARAGFNTPEDVRQVVAAIGNDPLGKAAAKGQFLQKLWDGATRRNPDTGRYEFSNADYQKQLRVIKNTAPEILTDNQRIVLQKIGDSIEGRAGVEARALRATGRQSATGQTINLLDVLHGSIADQGFQAVKTISPVLGNVLDAIRKHIGGGKDMATLINKELASFAMNPQYAEQLLMRPAAPAAKSLADTFAGVLKRGLLTSLQGAGNMAARTAKGAIKPLAIGAIPAVAGSMFHPSMSDMKPLPNLEAIGSAISQKATEAPKELAALWGEVSDPLLDAVRQVESSGKDNAISRDKSGNPIAFGPYQFTPATMKDYGLTRQTVFDPEKAREAARAKLLADTEHFGGDIRLALAAYNAGRGRVDRLLKQSGGGTFEDIADSLPAETQKYIPKVEDVLSGIINAA